MSASPEPVWYISRAGEQHGPLSNSVLLRLAELGGLREDDLVWQPGFKAWVTAASFLGVMKGGSEISRSELPEEPSARREGPPRDLPSKLSEASAPDTINGINDQVAKWIKMLPLRWALGGFLIAMIWSLFSGVLQGGFANPVGGHLASIGRLLYYIILPMAVLGFVWGWSERSHLERASGNQSELQEAARRSLFWHTGKAMACGAAFGLFTYGLGHIRAFQPWTSEENAIANLVGLAGFVILAIPVGLLVGTVTRRSLLARLRPQAGPRVPADGASDLTPGTAT